MPSSPSIDRCRPLLLVLSALAWQPAAGVEPTSLEPLVVTGTRTEKALRDTPVRIEIVGAEELRRTHARTLSEALLNVPGLQLQEVHGKSGHQVSLQGLSSDQVLVLIDGLPIAASTGSTVDLSQYALAEVERIEVVKGATSAQYGSSAMGGVINVITRPIEPGLRTQLRAEAGSYGAQNVSGDATGVGRHATRVGVEGGTQTLRTRLSGERIDDRGFTLEAADWPRAGGAAQREQYAARVAWMPQSSSSAWLDGNWYAEQDHHRYTYFAPPNRLAQHRDEDIERLRLSAGARHAWASGLRAEIKALDEDYDSDSLAYSQGDPITRRRAALGQNQVSAQFDLPQFGRQGWTLGADWRRETLTQTSNDLSELAGGRVERRAAEVFVQNDMQFSSSLELLAGLRLQDDSDFGGHAASRLALRARLPAAGAWNTDLRLAWGQGYRVPNLKERHFLFDHSQLGYRVIGNPGLEPESSHSLQAGLTLASGTRLDAEINLFRNDVSDLIQTDLDNAQVIDGVAWYSYQNIARARTQGLESVLRWRSIAAPMAVRAAYTFTDAEDRASGRALTRRPRHMARLGLDWDALPRTTLTLRARHQSAEYVDSDSDAESPAWTVVDLKLNHDAGRGLALFLGIDNAFDRQRDFASGVDFGPIDGRFIYLGALFEWARS